MNEDKKSPLDNYVSKNEEEETVTISSRKKLFWLAITVSIINPIFAGLIMGVVFWSEPELKKEAKIIVLVSITWGLILMFLSNWLIQKGYLPYQF